ncbi:MAG: hypothetical protein ACRELF_01245 [Gemmataceae bacterium]
MTHWLTITGRFVFRLLVSALLWALGFALVLGIFGVIASIADKKPDLWWQVAAFGAYLGALWGIGAGIKAFFGVIEESESSGRELAQEAGKNVLGGLVPGLPLLNLVADVVVWSRRAQPARDAGKRALLEAIAWSIIAIGMIVLIYGILALDMGDFSIWYALLFVPAAAVFGAIRGAYTTTKLAHSFRKSLSESRRPS